MARIGFTGLGHMGLPMAINLVRAGHEVTGYDLQSSALNAFAESGGVAAGSLKEVSKDQDVVITMLQKGKQVLDVCSGSEGVFSYLEKGSLFIDCSTIDVASARKLHQQADELSLLVVDAPVSGGVAGAAAASLTFMVGGNEEAFNKAKPILSAMGQKIIHTGEAGSGQAAKICNNMILGISMIGISEAFILAEHLGLSANKLFEVVTNASGQCWAMSKYVPVPGILEQVPANKNYEPGFAAAMMLKDLVLSQECALSVHVDTPLGQKAKDLYQELINQGYGEKDFSAIIHLIQSGKST